MSLLILFVRIRVCSCYGKAKKDDATGFESSAKE